MPLWLFDAILVGLVGLVVGGVVLRLCHLCNSMNTKSYTRKKKKEHKKRENGE